MESPPTADAAIPSPEPSPGRRSPWWLIILAPALLVAVVLLQRPPGLDPAKLAELESGRLVMPPDMSPEVAIGKLAVAYHKRPFLNVDISAMMIQQLDPPPMGVPSAKLDLPQDRFRTAVLVGKLGDTASMRERFERLKPTIDPESPLRQDIATAAACLNNDPVEPKARDALIDRHGWFGRLLFDDGAAGGVIDRAKQDGERLITVVTVAMVVMIVLVGLGILAVGVIAVLMLSGSIRPWHTPWRSPPNHPDSRRLWLETVALFLGGFLLLKLVIVLLALVARQSTFIDHDILMWVQLIAQWLLVGVLFWPRIRGLPAAQHRAEVGWHRGRGFFTEVGTGVLAYLALLPFYFLMAVVVTIGMLIYYTATGQKQPPIDNKVVDLASGGGVELFLVFLLVTIWAPVVEETIFRGAIYRLARSRFGVIAAALISAAIFAAMHAYMIPQIILVGTLGFGFALMREWRGSLIPSMTAHCLHNTLVFIFIASVAPIMQG